MNSMDFHPQMLRITEWGYIPIFFLCITAFVIYFYSFPIYRFELKKSNPRGFVSSKKPRDSKVSFDMPPSSLIPNIQDESHSVPSCLDKSSSSSMTSTSEENLQSRTITNPNQDRSRAAETLDLTRLDYIDCDDFDHGSIDNLNIKYKESIKEDGWQKVTSHRISKTSRKEAGHITIKFKHPPSAASSPSSRLSNLSPSASKSTESLSATLFLSNAEHHDGLLWYSPFHSGLKINLTEDNMNNRRTSLDESLFRREVEKHQESFSLFSSF